VRLRLLLPVLSVALLLGACSDDGGEDEISADPAALTSIAGTSGPTETTAGPTAGPTAGAAACADLADRYVRQARRLFDIQDTPTDALVDEVRARLVEFDGIASTAGCGEAYLSGVCEGLDALSAEGLLVIYPLTTAQCL